MRISLNRGLLDHLGKAGVEQLERGRELCGLLETNDFEGFADRLCSFLSGIPYQWHASGDLARYEAWYASLLHMCNRAIGVDVRVEDASSHGRADMVVLTGGQAFVLEFKMAEDEGHVDAALDAAISQMRERRYAEKYLDREEPVHLLGVACGREARNLLKIRAEPARPGVGAPEVQTARNGCRPMPGFSESRLNAASLEAVLGVSTRTSGRFCRSFRR